MCEIRGRIIPLDGSSKTERAIELLGLRRDCKPLKFRHVRVKTDSEGNFTLLVPRKSEARIRWRDIGQQPLWFVIPDKPKAELSELEISSNKCG